GVGKLATTVTGAVATTAGAAVGQATQVVKQLPKPVVHSIPFAVMALFGFNIILLLMGVWRELRESDMQKRLLTRLKAVNEAKTTFIGLASHYLRTALTTLLGGIEMLQEEKKAARAVLAQAAKAAEIGEHMRATVQ